MLCWPTAVKLNVSGRVNEKICLALTRLEKLLQSQDSFPLEQAEQLKQMRWQDLIETSPEFTEELEALAKQGIVREIIAVFLIGDPSLETLAWLANQNESQLSQFAAIMTEHPTMKKWLDYKRS